MVKGIPVLKHWQVTFAVSNPGYMGSATATHGLSIPEAQAWSLDQAGPSDTISRSCCPELQRDTAEARQSGVLELLFPASTQPSWHLLLSAALDKTCSGCGCPGKHTLGMLQPPELPSKLSPAQQGLGGCAGLVMLCRGQPWTMNS